MATYVDYTYYTATYLGTLIASADFAKVAKRASKQIDALTFGRTAAVITANTDTTTIDAIKMATCAVAEEIQKDITNDGRDNITAERVGNVSVNYGDKSQMARTLDDKTNAAARLYLWETDLMFKGLNADER